MKELTNPNSLQAFLRETQCLKLLETNSDSQKYGLSLSERDALRILDTAGNAMNESGRIELDATVFNSLIVSVCDSPYLDQDGYATVVCDIIEAFYYAKTAMMDEVADDELICFITKCFNGCCQGSVELLYDELDRLARDVRRDFFSGNAGLGEDE